MSDMNKDPIRSPKIEFENNVRKRHRSGLAWRIVFIASTSIGILALVVLLLTIINQSFGYVHYEARVDPDSLRVDGLPLEEQSKEQLLGTLQAHLSSGAYNKLDNERSFEQRTQGEVYDLVIERVVDFEVEETWPLWDSLTRSAGIRASVPVEQSGTELRFVAWVNLDYLRRQQSSNPVIAGIRTAILGSLWTIGITILVAFPLGVMASIYLEEYAVDNWLNRIIQVNITNLAGVPSIIYGILGLAIFVRALEPFTSGKIFGVVDLTTANGRTILSAGLTLAVLVLPLIIINAQEAIRAVPNSLRNASYGIGATKWQTVWSHVLPNAMPGILTGTILAVSRALGETAPLVVVGASTVIFFDPENVFSKFTTLPIQIYQWTSRPQEEFHFLAAAAIIALLVMLLSLNAAAILLRNRFSRSY